MSQERTEQQGNIDFKRENEALELAKSQLRDLDAYYRSEIDRLNAVNAELEKATLAHMDYIRVINPAKESWRKRAIDYRSQLHDKEGIALARAESIRDLTAKVQERDKYIDSLTDRHIALGADVDKRDKEIERLVATLKGAEQKCR